MGVVLLPYSPKITTLNAHLQAHTATFQLQPYILSPTQLKAEFEPYIMT